jgi:hypothetical protein
MFLGLDQSVERQDHDRYTLELPGSKRVSAEDSSILEVQLQLF